MDLGLNQLTHDQLLELVQQACQELAVRDPYVRNIAQETITTEAERLKLKREALKNAVYTVAQAYVADIQAEVLLAVREGVKQGTIRLLTPAQEARKVVDSTLEAKIKLIDETAAAIQSGKLTEAQAWQASRSPYPDEYRDGIPSAQEYAIEAHRLRQAQQNAPNYAQPPVMPPHTPIPVKKKRFLFFP